MFKLSETTTAFCMACDKWKTVGVFTSEDMPFYQLCPECLAEFVIQIDPRITFKLHVKKSKIKFDWINYCWLGLEIPEIKEIEKIYPDIDVVTEFKKMREWLYNNRTNEKAHKSQWHSFITRWLARAQQKAVIG
jgi:hypothetical protein